MKVYYLTDAYPERRCIINKEKTIEYEFIDRRKKLGYLIYLCKKKLFNLPFNWDKEALFSTKKNLNGIIHTFNTVCKTNSLWCSTYESTIPRDNYTCDRNWEHDETYPSKYTIKLLNYIAKDNCIACIALSESAKRIQVNMLENLSNKYLERNVIDKIINKIQVINPPQDLLVTEEDVYNKFRNSKKIEFIFVGRDFFRKGGKELLNVLDKFSERYDFNLTIVSSLNYGDYATLSTYEEFQECKKMILSKKWITYYSSLTNNDVIKLCKKAHIGLLPTFADTYGYSLLEMQACGCACITTNIRALPEINNEKCGWICNIPKDHIGGEALFKTNEQKENMKAILEYELEKVFTNIFVTPKSELCEKGIRSLRRIKDAHCPIEYSKKMMQIYNKLDE